MPQHPYPTFLIIGVAKGGTTALYHQLNEHPSIYMSRIKEPRFFNHDGYCPIVPGEGRPDRPETPEDYRALFDGVKTRRPSARPRRTTSRFPTPRRGSTRGTPPCRSSSSCGTPSNGPIRTT